MLNQKGSPEEDEQKNPIEDAQKITRQMVADEIVETQLAKGRAERAEAEARAAKAMADARKAESGEDKSQESPFKVEGKFNMGTIDFQAQQREAQEELKRLRDEADKQLQAQGQVNQQLRDDLHKKELDILQIGLQSQIQQSNERLELLIQQLGTRKTFMEEYNEALTTAKQLGMMQPQLGGDATVQIELKKMEFDHSMALRKMMREEKQADRDFQLQLKKFDDDREFRREELERQKKRDDMFASAPETFGRVVARGLMEGGRGEIEGEAAAPVGGRGRQPAIIAGVGEAGETECPKCHAAIAIGPTARTAVCANCGAKYPIKRVAPEAEAAVEEE